ncbi:MAG TPA: PKD domain-containing protein [Telluria sp.]
MHIILPGAWRAIGAMAVSLGLLAGCGGGGGGDSIPAPAPAPANAAPLPTLTFSGQGVSSGGSADVSTFAGSEVLLDAGASKDPDGDVLTYVWTLVSKPQASMLVLAAGTSPKLAFKPDVPGTYVAGVRITDSRGASAEKHATILVEANMVPVTSVAVSASYTAVPSTAASRPVTVGAAILLDGSGSSDADGDLVTTTWLLLERPAGSSAGLTLAGKTARLVTDVAGLYKVRARGTDPSGAYSETVYPFQAFGNAPLTLVLANVTEVVANAGSNTVEAAVGYTVALSGSGSSDPDGNTLSYAWTLVSKPAGSSAALTSATGAFSQLAPDVLGSYVVKLVATDARGAASTYQTTVSVNNRRPVAAISSNATPVAQASGPALRLPVNTALTLRGTGSSDADGDALTYSWTLATRPDGSTATLSAASGATVQLTTDVAGSYQVRLRVTDAAGAYSEQVLNIESGNTPPVAVTNVSRVSVLAGTSAGASASFSYDDDGDTLTYAWAIDARPAGSSATIAAPTASQLAFTPDVAGTYVASLSVTDGKSTGVAYVTIKALASVTTDVTLPFVPLEWRYSRGIDRFVAIATNPNALHIVDPFTASMRQVPLPMGVKAFNLSPDGKLAAVLHEGIISLVDLETATLLRSTLSGGSQTDAFPTNAGMVYLVGHSGGQWNNPAVHVINGRTGANLTSTLGVGYATFYGTQRGVFAATKNKVFLMSSGLSPADIDSFTINPATGAVVSTGESPYHGDFSMNSPFYLSGNEDLLFTSSATFFHTDTLKYAGRLSISGTMQSMSHSSSADQALTLSTTYTGYYPYTVNYPASYQRFSGALFLPDADVALPLVAGLQSYGIAIFHSANDNHVALVQTGGATATGTGIKYYLVTR